MGASQRTRTCVSRIACTSHLSRVHTATRTRYEPMTTCELSGVQTAPAVKLSTDCDDAAVEGSLPSQPVVSVESLAVAYVIVLHSLAETLFEHTGPADGDVCSEAV